ncbi:MAG: alanine--tRNA ligase [Gammaproteobacteria bacterium CG_4_10_14_0_8_um_filter_38_16]|nr:MAG: alanine--tRNA ligase [Gammaproteobacteria bacterium CG_4_10_14_0_8_um_filter_38_16]PJA03496.1 MAG: alanine--tRNA ligase [Gammaproteobacteria bacterium CG_4_10_14_0_2_um_filter_38_22]
MSSNALRTLFLEYFKQHQHTVVASSSLVPVGDATLLFTNAGMVQFKDVFLGLEKRAYTRATSSQRCVRAGGKHNDLENVGYTKRHHTFFEMLGSFSFGDYFKKEAIVFAWHFLTKELRIPPEKLWVTVFQDDLESEKIWLNEIKVDPDRFSRCGEKDNFWSMGDVGPCGPCTEIFYDHGPAIAGGPPGSPDESGDRYTEIWNLVFMQFNRDMAGQLTPLPKPCVDTGMGLERIAAVMQGVHDNYDIDIFQTLLRALAKLVNCDDVKAIPMRVIVDHIRSAAFLIADGVTPSNEGRGYVVRRIIRRAARYGFKLGQQKAFFYRLVPALVKEMGDAYPQLIKAQSLIEQVIKQEEKQFSSTLSKGLKILDKEVEESNSNTINGQLMFQLYDTYGFPPDLTIDIAKERGLQWDYDGFQAAMLKQREQSQQSQLFNRDQTQQVHLRGETEFTGYEKMIDEGRVITLLHDFKPVNVLKTGEKGIVILDCTPFYAESGGQVGDVGYFYCGDATFHVTDTQKKGSVVLHEGKVISGEIALQTLVRAEVDPSRHSTKLNHSATHLLHEALRRVLGEHVIQKGSLVEPKRLRFDFSHPHALTSEEITEIEKLINQQIIANFPLNTEVMALEAAKSVGAMALFSEKYADEVRVVSMGKFSTEICGGTHVNRTGDIGLFKITTESACAAGVRRIEAVTGSEALQWIEAGEKQLQWIADALKISRNTVSEKVAQLLEQNKQLTKELAEYKQKIAHHSTGELSSCVKKIGNVSVLIEVLPETDRESLRHMVDQLKQQLGKSIILLASTADEKNILIASVSKECLSHVTAPDLLKAAGGKGGGRPDLAQGGADDLSKLNGVLEWVEKKIENA